MSINKYYEYIEKSINNNHITNLIPSDEDSLLDLLIKELSEEDIDLNIKEIERIYEMKRKNRNTTPKMKTKTIK